jgi:hypothetical protein
LLFVVPAGVEDSGRHLLMSDASIPVWLWHPSREAMPTLPHRQQRYRNMVETTVETR